MAQTLIEEWDQMEWAGLGWAGKERKGMDNPEKQTKT